MHTIKPLDGKLIDELVESTGALVTAEDHSIIGGLGGAVAEYLAINRVSLRELGLTIDSGNGQADEMLELD